MLKININLWLMCKHRLTGSALMNVSLAEASVKKLSMYVVSSKVAYS